MTDEQIASLRKRAETDFTGSDSFAGREVNKLLDEREALLATLRPIVERLNGDREFVCPDGGAEMLNAARAAIAKAEAP